MEKTGKESGKMESKEKMEQIFDAMADMTLEMISESRERLLYLEQDQLEMVRTTQSLYETINHANQSSIDTGKISTKRRDVEKEVGINPLKC